VQNEEAASDEQGQLMEAEMAPVMNDAKNSVNWPKLAKPTEPDPPEYFGGKAKGSFDIVTGVHSRIKHAKP
jgi:hypothetical protein